MPLDLAAMLRNAIFETKTRLHSLEQALKHVTGGAEPATSRRKRGKKAGAAKGTRRKAKEVASEPTAKTVARRKPAKKSKRKRRPAAKGGGTKSTES